MSIRRIAAIFAVGVFFAIQAFAQESGHGQADAVDINGSELIGARGGGEVH